MRSPIVKFLLLSMLLTRTGVFFCIFKTEITFGQYGEFCEATGYPNPDDNGWGQGSRW